MSILTIAIPTYNRVHYLNACLKSLKEALPNNCNELEILVIDNDSTDNTEEVVNNIKKMDIKYIKNNTNIGPDENFKKCIIKANSKFVWLFGDDDIFFKDSIEFILSIIKNNNNLGLIHLRAKNFQDEKELLNYKTDNFSYENIKSKDKFINKIHTNITFISANIFNKDILKGEVNLKDIPNNNLGQVYWNMVSTIKGDQNIFCKSKVFAARQFNSGNYNFCEVFGKNFIETLYMVNEKFHIDNFIKIFKKRLLIMYFPANIARLRAGVSKVQYKNCLKIFYKIFYKDIYFWIFTFPALVFPKQIVFQLYKIVEKMNDLLN